MLPGVVVQVSTASSAPTDPTDTGQCFAAMVTQRGSSTGPTLLSDMVDYGTLEGARQTSSIAYDASDTYFGEKGKTLYVARVVAAAAAQATLNLLDSGAGICLVVKAGILGQPDPGTWANGAAGGLAVQVTQPGSGVFQLLTFLNSVSTTVPVETSPPLTAVADAVGWATKYSKYLQVSLGATSLIPAVAAATNLAGGSDGSVANSDYQTALNNVPSELGPGQVTIPGATSSTLQLMALDHAQKRNRFALLDGTDTATAATIVSQAQALYGAPNLGRRYGQLVAPYDIAPGLTSLSTRTVPPSMRLAAEYARVDALGNPNQAAAGRYGRAQYVQDISQPNWIEPDRLSLNNAGVTISRRRPGGVIATYGLRTLADQTLDKDWSQAANVRAIMWASAQFKAIGDEFDFTQIDGNQHALGDLKGALAGPAKVLFDKGALFGATPSEAYSIDTSPAVNPVQQLEDGLVVATAKLRFSKNAEGVQINIVNTALTQSV